MREEIVHTPLSALIFTSAFKTLTTPSTHTIASLATIALSLLLVKIATKIRPKHYYKSETLAIYSAALGIASTVTTATTNHKIVLIWYILTYTLFLCVMFSITYDLHIHFSAVSDKPSVVIRQDADYYIFPGDRKVTICRGDTKITLTKEEFETLKHILDRTDFDTLIHLM